jgi:hypothetical protein
MPKIRGVKPDLWTDENFVELSPYARLLWIGLWNHACDNGHLQDKSKQIKMRVLPTDDVNCAELLREIAGQQLIEQADGWITIPNLSHHQKPHKRWWTTCDKPGCVLPEGTSHAPDNRSNTVAPPKRNRVATADCDGEGDGELKVTEDPSRKRSETDPRFEEFWETYGHKKDRANSERKWRLALKKPNVTADLLIAAAAAYVLHERTNNEGGRYIMGPAKWLLNERWTDERVARAPEMTRVGEHMALARRLAAEEQAALELSQ